MLLEYFGEKNTHDCGQCDVCLSNQGQTVANQQTPDASQAILQLLSDGQRHHPCELHRLPFPTEAIDAALRHLLSEEHIYLSDGFIADRFD